MLEIKSRHLTWVGPIYHKFYFWIFFMKIKFFSENGIYPKKNCQIDLSN